MSSPRRARSASVASKCSNRFFSRITFCERCGFDHKFGSADCFSISLSCGRSLSASKILPELAPLLAQCTIFLLDLLIHDDVSSFLSCLLPVCLAKPKRVSSAPVEIIAHSHANQSPCRV